MNNLSILCVSYNQKYNNYSIQIDISLSYPSYREKMYSVSYEMTLNFEVDKCAKNVILKEILKV